MPVYNSGVYLKTAVDSVLCQSLKDFELILVDDGSTDGSSELCDYYSASDCRVTVIHQSNQGICAARNAALAIAKGEFIAFSDHDDEYHKDLLMDNYKIAHDNDLDFIKFCREEKRITVKGKVYRQYTNIVRLGVYTRKDVPSLFYDFYENKIFACVWDGLFKREFIEKNNIRFDTFFKRGGEDYIFNLDCLKYTKRFGTNDGCYYYHIMRDSFSTSSKIDPNQIEVSKKVFRKALEVLNSYNYQLDESKPKYTHFYIKEYLAPIMNYLVRAHKPYADFENNLEQLKREPEYFSFMKSINLSIIQDSFYSLVNFLFKNRCYRTLYFLYKAKS